MERWARVALADIDDELQDAISGEVGWQQKEYEVTGSGTHTLKWRYVKDGSVSEGDDCGWVDYVQWTPDGSDTTPIPETWETATYVYDVAGRRIAKAFDGQVVRQYLYDGSHCIAEYDGDNHLLRKYVYGPGVDQPICMTEVADSNAVYYYHFDGLGSVVALSDADGDTVQTYEYTVYGQPAASDPNHPNPFLFTGRRFDPETGLYHYRARAYNPYIGRFLQTDPAGQGMNAYAYCANDPIGMVDPSGQVMEYSFGKYQHPSGGRVWLRFSWADKDAGISGSEDFMTIGEWVGWAMAGGMDTEWDASLQERVDVGEIFGTGWEAGKIGRKLSGGNREVFWYLRALMWFCPDFAPTMVYDIETCGFHVTAEFCEPTYEGFFLEELHVFDDSPGSPTVTLMGTVSWAKGRGTLFEGSQRGWWSTNALATLAHELGHAWHFAQTPEGFLSASTPDRECAAMTIENLARWQLYKKYPSAECWMYPRPGYRAGHLDLGGSPAEAWANYTYPVY